MVGAIGNERVTRVRDAYKAVLLESHLTERNREIANDLVMALDELLERRKADVPLTGVVS
jgi:protoheme ferro-lyase